MGEVGGEFMDSPINGTGGINIDNGGGGGVLEIHSSPQLDRLT